MALRVTSMLESEQSRIKSFSLRYLLEGLEMISI